MTAESILVDRLGFGAGTIPIHAEQATLTALQRHYVKQAERFGGGDDGIDSIYFSGEQPSVYFKTVADFTPETVSAIVRLQRKVWNQGKVPFLYVESPTQVRVYNCYATPQRPSDNGAEGELCLMEASLQAQQQLEELRRVFGKVAVESGSFWDEAGYAKRVQSKTRVNETLTANLKETRARLRAQGLPVSIIHDLLLRSLFILYLEDRKATDEAFYRQYAPEADSYFKILTDKQATYALFETLESAFNGNLCPVQLEERPAVTAEHLRLIRACFYAELPTQQLRLLEWRIFDFEVIPIQVISEIYEDFLREEDGADHMRQQGAFYTPHALAEFVLNEVLPYPSATDTRYAMKTLDPTCGSGVFLVDSLNRLLDRWEYAHQPATLTFEVVKKIVLENIFGIEVEAEAIKVAAFSIYLAMLDRLNPKTLWQNNHFPYLIHRPDNPESERQGHNLFLMSSLEPGPFEQISFDLVIGNPPFTNKVSADVKAYLTGLGFAMETVLAFLHRATTLCPNGKIALISTSKILFNTGSNYQHFRRFLFNDTYVERVYNFSALRRGSRKTGGRNLFASAQRPVCVLLYSKQTPAEPSQRLTYYAPTTTLKNRLVDGIVIDPTDIKFLPRAECQQPDTKIWKAAMWGTERDYQLVKRLLGEPPLSDYLAANGYAEAVGFETSPIERNNTHTNAETAKLRHLPAEGVLRHYTQDSRTVELIDEATGLPRVQFRREGNSATYKAPHLLIKEGQAGKRFCASYLDFDCSFRRTIYGISAPDKAEELKLLTAYLNSSFASYIMFLTASDWGVERERVSPNEMLALPSLCFDLPQATKQHIVRLFDEIITIRKADFLDASDDLQRIEQQIEKHFWDGLGLSGTDRMLIEDLLAYRLGAFQDREKSVAFRPCTSAGVREYAGTLCQTVNHFVGPDAGLRAHAAYFSPAGRPPLQVLALHLDEKAAANAVAELSAVGLGHILHEIEAYTYREKSESIYYRRFIRYYVGDVVYLVKPNERRFWSQASALSDADEIIAEILSAEA